MSKGKKASLEAVQAFLGEEQIKTDVLGSYTGTGSCDDEPEQDADDL